MSKTPTPTLIFEVRPPERQPHRVTLIKTRNLIGRETGDVVLGDPEASALHAEIDTTTGHVIVRDLGSSNGTWRDGRKLPQFALFEGQAFYCGNTELVLVSIEGQHEELRPGQTAVGRTKVKSQASSPPKAPAPAAILDTFVGSPNQAPIVPPPGWSPPSPVSLGQPAPVAETTHVAPRVKEHVTLTGAHAPSSSPTAPGIEPSRTLPVVSREGSARTVPGPAGTTSATPSSRTLPTGVSQSGAPEGQAPPSSEDSETGTDTLAETGAETRAEPPAPAVFRPPVANAVIKSGADAPRSHAHPSKASRSRSPRRWGRLLAIAGLSALGVTAVAGLGYLVYTLLAGRALAFADQVAEELPDTAIGFVALRSIDDAVALLADADDEDDDGRSDQWKLLRVDAMGFDPFDAEAWSSQGIAPSAPVGVALLDATAPTYAVSFGVTDRAKFEAALHDQVPRLLGLPTEDVHWSDRTFGALEGSWEEERGVAVLHREGRSVVVFAPRPGWADDVEEQAKALGALTPERSLAKTEAYAGLIPPPGDTLAMGYVDGGALRNALPTGAAALAARLALADLDGIGLLFSHDGAALHLTHEVVVREGSRHLEVLDGVERDGKALTRLGAPVLAAYDVQLDGPALDRALGGMVTALGESLPVIEKEISSELGIDLRTDVTQNLSGGFGAALLALPPDREHEQDLKAAVWVGVLDGDEARKTLERVYEKSFTNIDGVDVSKREVGDAQVFTMPGDAERERPEFQLFVHDGAIWLLVGAVDAAMITAGPDTPFPKDARHPSIAAAMATGGVAAGFLDVESFVAALRPSLRERDLEDLERVQPVVDLFQTATVRIERDGRTLIVRNTAHLADDVGLRGLVQAATTLMGNTMSTELARASRASRCAQLSKHVLELSRKSLEDAGAPLETAWEIERSVQEQCDGPTMTTARLDCYLAADSIQGLAACDSKHPARSPPEREGDAPKEEPGVDDQPEPKVVPYVDDIWPHRVDDPDSDSPQPDVNYAVPLGDDPDARGRPDALVTIVMFGDFECQHCRAVVGTLDEVLAQHGDDVRLVFRHLPLENVHPSARAAAKAALAASAQNEFWAMHDALFDRGNRLDDDAIDAAAREAGLDMTRYATDMASADVDRRLQRDIDTATKFGIKGTPAFFINGRYLGGRQSASAFNAVIDEELGRAKKFAERRGNTRKRLYEDMLAHFAPEVVQPETAVAIPSLDAKRYSISTEGLPHKGANSFAQVEIVECGDFDCPFCARSRKALDETLAAFSGVTLYFAHNPLDYHSGAEPAARAAAAANEQGKFWEMHDELFKDQRSKARTDDDYERYAARLGLDVEQFVSDYESDAIAAKVAAQQKLCTENDATATPTFFINGRRVTGAQSAEQLEALVESELSGGI